jgi:hypothetical protein
LAEHVPAGKYLLVVSAIPEVAAGQPQPSSIIGQKPFTIPADPPAGALDLGQIGLSAVAK